MVEEDKTLAGLKELVSVYDLKAEALALIREMRDALDRQCDNMAFAINHSELHHWTTKFSLELEEDREALARADQFLKEHS